ncbi:MAG TPA: hypothetical protein VF158_05445, partial [Longimicrobiales bacterium]
MRVPRRSILTGAFHLRDVPVTRDELRRHERGELAQSIWPHLSPEDREFMVNGVTPEEWAALLP